MTWICEDVTLNWRVIDIRTTFLLNVHEPVTTFQADIVQWNTTAWHCSAWLDVQQIVGQVWSATKSALESKQIVIHRCIWSIDRRSTSFRPLWTGQPDNNLNLSLRCHNWLRPAYHDYSKWASGYGMQHSNWTLLAIAIHIPYVGRWIGIDQLRSFAHKLGVSFEWDTHTMDKNFVITLIFFFCLIWALS